MRPSHKLDPYLEQAVEEHELLHHAVMELKALMESKPPALVDAITMAQAAKLFNDLHDKLQRHFAREEQGGYLEEALARTPRLAPQARLLQKQHAEFSLESLRIVMITRSHKPLPQLWAELQSAFQLFAKRLLAHEAAEDSLLEQAFNEDLGTDTK